MCRRANALSCISMYMHMYMTLYMAPMYAVCNYKKKLVNLEGIMATLLPTPLPQ